MRRFLLPFVLVFAFSLFGEIEYGIQSRGEHAIPLDWSTCTFDEAIDETFGIKLNGENVNDSLIMRYKKILKNERGISISAALIEACKEFYHSNKKIYKQRNIALVRILLYGNDGNCYVYNMPYVFLSGEQVVKSKEDEKDNQSIISMVVNSCKTQGLLSQLSEYYTKKKNNDYNIIERIAFHNITSFSFSSQNKKLSQAFAHSERAIGLFLNQENILKEINTHFNVNAKKPNVQIQKIIIQIMTKNSMCSACAKFWKEKAKYATDTDIGNKFLSDKDSSNSTFKVITKMKKNAHIDENTKIFIKAIYTIEK